jgi:deoxyribonuclease-4
MVKIYFGTAGNIASNLVESIKKLKQNNLNSQEVEFVRGVRMDNKTAMIAGNIAKENNIILSVHAPYYINLASDEYEKREASKKRIMDSCEKAHYLGAKNVVFHAAFYQKKSKEEVYKIVKESILEIQKIIKEKEWSNVKLSPETTGKESQFGDIDELLKLKQETNCDLCVDFAHIYARQNGNINYKELFKKFNDNKITYLHCHFSGIEYTQKGEKKHIPTKEEFIMPLISEAIKHKITLNIINESPQPFVDGKMSKELYENHVQKTRKN